jgi:hypothetical protein
MRSQLLNSGLRVKKQADGLRGRDRQTSDHASSLKIHELRFILKQVAWKVASIIRVKRRRAQ